MKKLLFKVIFKFGIIIAVLMSVPYFMMGGTLPDWAAGLFSSEPDKPALPENLSSVVTDQEVTYYQWVDEQGQTHYSSTPPIGLAAEQKKLRPDTNLLQAVKVPQEEEASDGPQIFSLGSSKDGKSKKEGDEEAFNPYSPEGVQKLMDKAQDAKKLMENHNRQLGKITGE
jgi:hypothetical protein